MYDSFFPLPPFSPSVAPGAAQQLGEVQREIASRIEWRIQEAKKRNRKEKAMGGMILGIRKELVMREEEDSEKIEGMMIGKVKYDKGIFKGEYI